jgi:tryptophan synthase alpha chain
MAFELATTSSDDALAACFAARRAAGRPVLVAYLTAGFPDRASFPDVLRAVADAGADIIEVGLPFSDPLADGPVIQRSSQVALEDGTTFDRMLEMVVAAGVDVPLVLFSYLNPVMAAGPDALHRAAAAGFSGVLITDIPVGADPEREAWIGASPLAFIRLVAPTTPVDRMAEIVEHGRGFVYLISRTGVTGVRDQLPEDLPETVARLRSVCPLPIAVGFGIARPDQAVAVAKLAEGVVVGSALVQATADGGANAAAALTAALRHALDSTGTA